MAQRFIEPIARIFTNAGAVGVGYKYYFYLTGTTTPVTTYQDINLTVANTNPVLSDANGRFPEIWYSDLSQLKLIVKDSLDNTVETCDPVGATAEITSLNDFDVRPTSYWGLTTGTSTAYTLSANPTVISYNNSQTFVIQIHIDCANNPTLAIDSLTAQNFKKYTQQGTKINLKASDLKANQRYFCTYDGVDIVVLNPNSLPLLSGTSTALTISAGVITLTNNSSSYALDTEGAASSDDLDTINGGQDGQVIFLKSANNARNVVLKHATGNIFNSQNNNAPNRDITLDLTTDFVCLRYDSALAYWIVISNSFNYFANSKAVNGYTYLPNGLIVQWGEEASYHDVAGDYAAVVTFPITFPISCLQVIAGLKGNGTLGFDNDVIGVQARSQATTGFTIAMGEISTSGQSVKGNWVAFGY
jgi:hypothetical protein